MLTGTTGHLALATAFFLLIHVLPVLPLRAKIVGAIGEMPYRGLFSAVSLAGLFWMVAAFNDASFSGMAWYNPGPLQYLSALLVLIGFFLWIGGMTQPNPGAIGASVPSSGDPARGYMRISRHPFLSSVVLWGLAHLLVRGDFNALFFFGGLLLLAATGTLMIDSRRRASDPEDWARYSAVTSIIPFLAILQGRNHLSIRELSLWRPILSIVLYAGFLHGHAALMGVSPLP